MPSPLEEMIRRKKELDAETSTIQPAEDAANKLMTSVEQSPASFEFRPELLQASSGWQPHTGVEETAPAEPATPEGPEYRPDELAAPPANQPDINVESLTELGQSKAPVAPAPAAAAPLDPLKQAKASKAQQLVEAINAKRSGAESESPEQMHSRKAAQAFYAMSQGKSLPDSFFAAPAPKDTLVEDQRNLLRAQTAKGLLEPMSAAAKAAESEDPAKVQAAREAKKAAARDSGLYTPEMLEKIYAVIDNSSFKDLSARSNIATQVAGETVLGKKEGRSVEDQVMQQEKHAVQKERTSQLIDVTNQMLPGKLAAQVAPALKVYRDAVGEDMPKVLGAAKEFDRVTEGALTNFELGELTSKDAENSLSWKRKVNRLAQNVPSGLLAAFNEKAGIDATPEQTRAANSILRNDPRTSAKMAQIDSAFANMWSVIRETRAGKSLTQGEKVLFDQISQDLLGSTPAEKVAAMKSVLNSMANSVDVPYSSLTIAGDVGGGFAKDYIDKLKGMGGIISPDDLRFNKKLTLPANEQGVAEAVGNSPRPATVRLPPAMGQKPAAPMPTSVPVQEPVAPAAQAAPEATVKMRFPSGAVRDVPASQVENAKARKGATPVGQ